MTRSARRSAYRVVLAFGMVAALVNCGGSGDSSSDTRQRNAALECLPGDPAETTTTIENDPCAETTTTLYENESQTLTCDVRWEPGALSGSVIACPEATWLETSYPNTDGGSGGTSNQSTPSNRLEFGQYGEGTATVTVHIEKDGVEVAVGTVQFQTNVAATQSFTYEAPAAEPSTTTTVATEYEGPVVTCLVSWQTASSTITSCEETNGMQLQFFDESGSTVGDPGALSENPASGIAVPDGARYVDVKVFIPSAFGPESEPAGVVRLDTLTDGSNSTFDYHQAVDAPMETTTTTEPAPDEGEETTTTVEARDAIAATISVQEVPCEASYTAATRTIQLCENFDRTVGAAFGSDGKFTDTIETGYGNSFTLPANLVEGGGARFLRIAVGQNMSGIEGGIAVFRGEGIIDLADGTADVQGTIYVSPPDQEAVNTGGFPETLGVELTEAGLFEVERIEENELAFVMLEDQVYTEYEMVKPPASWDQGEPLRWRAYQNDGFGLPRLVASGLVALGGRTRRVEYMNPSFELNSQRVEILGGENAAQSPSTEGLTEDPCGAVDPYMITTPVTPSRTNLVTFTVATDCASTDSILGLVVYDYDEDEIPIFSQFKSTRFTSRIVATTFLADGQYDVLWGDYDLVGVHEYVVNGGGTGANCHHPSLDIDTETMKATLSDCDPGGNRMRVFADNLDWQESWREIRLPLASNVIDLQQVEIEGFFELEIKIDNSFEPDFLACIRACESAVTADPGLEVSFDTSTFSEDGGVGITGSCVNAGRPDGEGWQQYWSGGDIRLFRPAGRGAYIEENWAWFDSGEEGDVTEKLHLPGNGKVLSATKCYTDWYTEDGAWSFSETFGIHTVDITAPMPNRPSNDAFADAPAIEPGVGAVQFTNVSATNEPGEMGIEYSTSSDAGQFHSVWFTFTPEESARTSFRITDYTFDAVMRVTRRDDDGRTVLLDETEVWIDGPMYCDCDYSYEETVSFFANAGTTYHIQVTNEDWENQVGTATLLVNGGEGETVKVPAGDLPFATPAELRAQSPATTVPPTTTPPSTSTSTLVPVDTVAPGTSAPTVTTTPTQQQYSAALEKGSQNEVVTVLAPVGDAPATIEAREDARTVQIPVQDLYGTVSAASANVDNARPLMLRQKGHRPVKVRSSDRMVTVPVGTEISELNIVATTTDGKTVTAPLVVKKTVAPLVTVAGSGDSGSSLPVLPIGIAVAILALAGAGLALRRRGTAPAVDAPTED